MTGSAPAVTEVTSADGTVLGVETLGAGPALLAVHGGTADRSRWAPVKEALAESFTLHLLDRRGRGTSTRESGRPYAIELEADDVIAVAEVLDSPLFYLGHSYGALVGLVALPRLGSVTKALLYEPPFDTPGLEMVPSAFRQHFSDLLTAGKREEALELFYRQVINVDPAPIRDLPIWQVRIAAVHTLEREGDAVAQFALDRDALAGVQAEVRILSGTDSPRPFAAAVAAAAAALPNVDIVALPGQGHAMIDADPAGFVAHVKDFFLAA